MTAAILILLIAVALSVPLTAWLGSAAGWPLAAVYLLAAVVLWPTVREVQSGGAPQWSRPWISALDVDVALRADGLSVVFALIAILIGAVVFVYSARYLGDGPHRSFYLVMALFTTSMLVLVLADNLFLLFVCWELTSLASFILIARSGRPGEAASMRTLLCTFIGGLTLLAAITMIVAHTGTQSVHEALTDPVWRQHTDFTSVVAVLVAIAGFSKAAQFPLHVWLPDAMTAPTPVSAYLHAAAVVKAGIFVLLRFSPAFHDNAVWNALLISVGLLTALIGARLALKQTDLKRLMAYSTVSQLGLIVATIGVGTPYAIAAAILHTIAHALFKSGLFMMVGVVDHVAHTRDMRRLPPLWRHMPGSFVVTILGCAAMAGIPPLLGFVSKEGVFASLLETDGPWLGGLALGAAAVASVMTFLYCAKVVLGGFVEGRGQRDLKPVENGLVLTALVPIGLGVPLGLLPGLLDDPVGQALRAAVPGSDHHPHFALWHGITLELLVTVGVFAIGVWLTLRRHTLRPRLERDLWTHWGEPVDGPRVIQGVRNALQRSGRRVASFCRVDYPSRHIAVIFVLMVVAILGTSLSATVNGNLPERNSAGGSLLDVLLLPLITIGVLALCLTHSRLTATVTLASVGILCMVQIIGLGAPDVGLTVLLTEALTVVVIMLVLQRLPTRFGRSSTKRRLRIATLASLVGVAAGVATYLTTGRQGRSELGTWYLENTYDLSGGANVVNVILVEFRAFDTFGEMAVLGMAGVVLIAVLSTVRSKHIDTDTAHELPPKPEVRDDPVVRRALTDPVANQVALRRLVHLLNPILLVTAVVVLLLGHNNPGGGFIAALIMSATIGLTYVSTAHDRSIGPARLPLRLISGGILIAVSVGLIGVVTKDTFLGPLHGYLGDFHVTSGMVFDIGIIGAVLGLVLLAFNLLGTAETITSRPGGEGTRERADEAVEGELPGPLETTHGEGPGEAPVGVPESEWRAAPPREGLR